MDEESRALIEQMLAEEEFYYGKSTLPAKRKPKHAKESPKVTKKAKTSCEFWKHCRGVGNVDVLTVKKPTAAISSASLPSHKTRWTESEDALLRSAVASVSGSLHTTEFRIFTTHSRSNVVTGTGKQ